MKDKAPKHEIGHALGLEHPSSTSSIMFEAFEQMKVKTVQQGDNDAVVGIYGK